MMSYEEMLTQLSNIEVKLSKKSFRQLKIDQFKRLLERLMEENVLIVNPKDDPIIISEKIKSCFNALILYDSHNFSFDYEKRNYLIAMKTLIKLISKNYDLRPKGSYIAMYMAIGITLGTAVGLALMSINTSYYSLGISFGLVFGISLGNLIENVAIKAGKIY